MYHILAVLRCTEYRTYAYCHSMDSRCTANSDNDNEFKVLPATRDTLYTIVGFHMAAAPCSHSGKTLSCMVCDPLTSLF